MPPKKKQKISAAGDAAPSQSDHVHLTPQPAVTKREIDYEAIANDPWTDEQETALLKGIVRWKPVGIHKHFRMLAIYDYMRSQGYAPPTEEHTRIPGIWKKLGTLYNLEALDEREEPFPAETIEDSANEPYCPFQLPEDEYSEMMFERRLNPDGTASPSESLRDASRQPSTVANTDEPRSSPAPSRGARRGGRKTRSNRGGRGSRLQAEIEPTKSRSSGKASPAKDEHDGDDEDGDEETSDAGKEESEAESSVPRSTRTQATRGKSKRGRGGRRGWRGRRG
ncbi:hypothetical protein VTO42DRAFT_8453 [Malbranchea cinnamomea]